MSPRLLWLSKSRNEDWALHFEARSPRVSLRRAPDDALEFADIGSNSPQHGRVLRTSGTPVVAVIDASGTNTPRCGRSGGADRRFVGWRQCDRLTAG
jgi:hypothetical protein